MSNSIGQLFNQIVQYWPGVSKVLGERIRHYRTLKKMNGNELAKKAGVSRSLISQIEQGTANPSIDTLRKITQALEIPIVLLFEESNPSIGILVTKNKRKMLKVPESNLVFELLTPDLNRKIEFLWIEIEPGEQVEPVAFAHEGEECAVILEGQLFFRINDEEYILNPGDSISFDSSQPHSIANPGPEKVVLVTAITPPSF
jgi:transcriptional regulator with XRE-family HTH domain